MSWYRQLERRLSPFAIPNLTLYLVVGQTFVLLSAILGLLDLRKIQYWPLAVEHGEIWRIFTYLFMPLTMGRSSLGLILTAFGLYMLYLFGGALEQFWGAFHFNLFLFTGWGLTTGLAFVAPGQVTTNFYFLTTVLLAFAYLNPDFEMYLFFFLPVKAKWLGLFMWMKYVYDFAVGGLADRLSIVAAVGNFLIFFGPSIWLNIRTGRRRMQTQARRVVEERAGREPRHRCHVCNKTDLSNPELDFRYCSKCVGDQCYCPDHIRNHEHVTQEETAKR